MEWTCWVCDLTQRLVPACTCCCRQRGGARHLITPEKVLVGDGNAFLDELQDSSTW